MVEKKGFWATLFGGRCDCGMDFEEDTGTKKKTKKGGCCDMQILEEDDNEESDRNKTDQ
ncbi:MAG: hypothetical protein Q4E73_10070 [Lachnospiraceae bacterium]|nr:hypothetical protein [Lachnospiraceae bacterium]